MTRPVVIITPFKKGMFGLVNGLLYCWKQLKSRSSLIGCRLDMPFLFWSMLGFLIQNKEVLARRAKLASDVELGEYPVAPKVTPEGH